MADDIKTFQDQAFAALTEAEAAAVTARQRLRDAEVQERKARIAYAAALKVTPLSTAMMSSSELAELVADAARSHGAACADYREAYTSPQWMLFRRHLKELTERAAESDEIRRGRAVSGKILEGIMAPVSAHTGSLPMDLDTLLADDEE